MQRSLLKYFSNFVKSNNTKTYLSNKTEKNFNNILNDIRCKTKRHGQWNYTKAEVSELQT